MSSSSKTAKTAKTAAADSTVFPETTKPTGLDAPTWALLLTLTTPEKAAILNQLCDMLSKQHKNDIITLVLTYDAPVKDKSSVISAITRPAQPAHDVPTHAVQQWYPQAYPLYPQGYQQYVPQYPQTMHQTMPQTMQHTMPMPPDPAEEVRRIAEIKRREEQLAAAKKAAETKAKLELINKRKQQLAAEQAKIAAEESALQLPSVPSAPTVQPSAPTAAPTTAPTTALSAMNYAAVAHKVEAYAKPREAVAIPKRTKTPKTAPKRASATKYSPAAFAVYAEYKTSEHYDEARAQSNQVIAYRKIEDPESKVKINVPNMWHSIELPKNMRKFLSQLIAHTYDEETDTSSQATTAWTYENVHSIIQTMLADGARIPTVQTTATILAYYAAHYKHGTDEVVVSKKTAWLGIHIEPSSPTKDAPNRGPYSVYFSTHPICGYDEIGSDEIKPLMLHTLCEFENEGTILPEIYDYSTPESLDLNNGNYTVVDIGELHKVQLAIGAAPAPLQQTPTLAQLPALPAKVAKSKSKPKHIKPHEVAPDEDFPEQPLSEGQSWADAEDTQIDATTSAKPVKSKPKSADLKISAGKFAALADDANDGPPSPNDSADNSDAETDAPAEDA